MAPRSKLPAVLWFLSAAFIVYGTTIPFNFVHDRAAVLSHVNRVTWHPFVSAETGRRVSIPDFTSNVLLFLPFGCFGVWALRRPRALAARVLLLTVLAFLLSASVEILQLFTVDRTSSISDVAANTSGGLAGAVFGILFSVTAEGSIAAAAAAGLADARSLFPLVVATLVMLAGALEPIDVTLDVSSVFPKFRAFLHDPLQLGVPIDEGMSLLQHLLFTSALLVWLDEIRVRSPARIALIAGAAIAIAAEGSQLFIAARMPGVWDALVGVAGAFAGVAAGTSFLKERTAGRWWLGLVAVTAVAVAMEQLSPFTLAGDPRSFQWMPFRNYYEFTTSETVSHSAELILAYVPLGFGLALASRRRRNRLRMALGAAFLIAAPVEYLQQYVGGRFPDVTDIGLSLAGAWLGAWTATSGWRLFDEQILMQRRRVGTSAIGVPHS